MATVLRDTLYVASCVILLYTSDYRSEIVLEHGWFILIGFDILFFQEKKKIKQSHGIFAKSQKLLNILQTFFSLKMFRRFQNSNKIMPCWKNLLENKTNRVSHKDSGIGGGKGSDRGGFAHNSRQNLEGPQISNVYKNG